MNLARVSGDRVALLDALNDVAELQSIENDLATAAICYKEALALSHAIDARSGEVRMRLNLARLEVSRGEAAGAAQVIRTALDMRGPTVSRFTRQVLGIGAGIAAVAGDHAAAARMWGACNRQYDDTCQRREPADERALAPVVAKARDSLANGEFALEEAGGYAMRREGAVEWLGRWIDDYLTRAGSSPSSRHPSTG